MPITASSELEYYKKLDRAEAKDEALEAAREEAYHTILGVMDAPDYFIDKPFPLGMFQAAMDLALDDEALLDRIKHVIPSDIDLEEEIEYSVLVSLIDLSPDGTDLLSDIAINYAQGIEDKEDER